ILIDGVRMKVEDATHSPADRAEAARFLGHRSVFDGAGDLARLLSLLSPQTPPLLHEAAFDALARARHPATVPSLAERWSTLGPADRSRALSLFLGHADWTEALLSTLE